VACVRRMQCYRILALAHVHTLITCKGVQMHGLHMIFVVLWCIIVKATGVYHACSVTILSRRRLPDDLTRYGIGDAIPCVKRTRRSTDEITFEVRSASIGRDQITDLPA
jgi:hypothetical protein